MQCFHRIPHMMIFAQRIKTIRNFIEAPPSFQLVTSSWIPHIWCWLVEILLISQTINWYRVYIVRLPFPCSCNDVRVWTAFFFVFLFFSLCQYFLSVWIYHIVTSLCAKSTHRVNTQRACMCVRVCLSCSSVFRLHFRLKDNVWKTTTKTGNATETESMCKHFGNRTVSSVAFRCL